MGDFMKKLKIKVVFDGDQELPISDVNHIPEWADSDCDGALDYVSFRGELWDSAFRPMLGTDKFEDYEVKIERGRNFVKLSGYLVCILESDMNKEKTENFIDDLKNSVCVIFQANMSMKGSNENVWIGEQNDDYNPDDIGSAIASYSLL